jgi:DNA-binding transcriptional MocR family regulator
VAAELRGTLSGMPATKRLPTEAELCRTHGVSRQTAGRAYQELAVGMDRVYREQDGEAIESTLNYVNPARFTDRLELRRARRG